MITTYDYGIIINMAVNAVFWSSNKFVKQLRIYYGVTCDRMPTDFRFEPFSNYAPGAHEIQLVNTQIF